MRESPVASAEFQREKRARTSSSEMSDFPTFAALFSFLRRKRLRDVEGLAMMEDADSIPKVVDIGETEVACLLAVLGANAAAVVTERANTRDVNFILYIIVWFGWGCDLFD